MNIGVAYYRSPIVCIETETSKYKIGTDATTVDVETETFQYKIGTD